MMAKPAATKIRLRNKLHDRPPRPDPPLLRHLPPHAPPETRRRRSLRPRRRRQLSEDDPCEFDHEEEEEEREMKKIRLVVKLPSPPAARPRPPPPVVSSASSSSSSPSPSPASSSSSYVEDDSPWENGGEEVETVRPPRKRRIDSCGDVAAPLFSRSGRHEVRKKNAVGRSSGDGCGTLPSSWSGTPMPERKELELLLHKLQKNDIYGAFAEPVDPEELPDYHEVIEHPMDFSTVRKKLARGAYRFFEQFEDDVLLICSNAMQYNAPDTVYFRQACVIQDLARKKFQNVRDNVITETDQLTEEKATLDSMEKKALLTRRTPKTPRKAVAEPLLSDIYSGATIVSTSDTCTRLSTVNDIEKSVAVNGLLDASSSRRGSKKEKSVVVNELLDSSSAGAIKKKKSVAVNRILDTSSLVESTHERSVAVNKIRDTISSPGERKQEKSAAINRILDASLSPVGRKQEKSVAVNRFLDASSSPGERKQERSAAINRFLDASSSPGERKQEKSVAVNRFRSTSSSPEESNLENSVAVNRLLDGSSSPGESKPDRSVAVSGLLDGSSSLGESKQEKSVAINGLDATFLGERKQEKDDDFSGAIKKKKSVAVNRILDTSSLVESTHERSVAVNKIRDTISSPGERKQEKSAAINRILDASLSPVGRKQEESVAVNRFLDASSSPGERKQERSAANNRFLDASSSPGERKQEKSVAINSFRSTSSSPEESNLENSVAVNKLLDGSSSPGESKPDRSVAVSGLLDGSSSLGESKQEKSVAINGLDATFLGERKQEKDDDFSAKSSPSKLGRKPAVDENRRTTYSIIPEQKPTVESNFVLNVLEDEPKQLVPVGLDTEHSYARSLAQFAASLGPFAWEIVSKRIQNSLPPGIKFGPGWVGEYEPLPAPFLSAGKHDQQLANSSASFSRTDKKEKVVEMKSKQQLTAAAHKKTPNAVKGTFCDLSGEQKPRPLGVCSTTQSKVNGTFGQKQCSDSSSINSGVNSQTSIRKSFIGTVRVKEESLSEEIAERRQEVFQANNSTHPVPRTISHQPKNQAATFANVSPQSNTSPSSKVRHSSFPGLFSRESSHMQTEKDFRAISSQNLNNVPDIVTGGSNNATRANNSMAFIPSNQTAVNYGFNRGNNLDQASNDPFKLASFPGKAGSHQNLSMPIVSQFSKENFSPATSAARSWMSVGTSAQWKPVDGKNSSEKFNISSPFSHASWRPPQFNGDSANLLLQAEAPQVKNRGLVIFPQLIPTDLSKYKNHPHWHGSSPQTPSKKRDNLPPDLNIGYQHPTSPIHPSSNLAMDSQHPDLALQL